MIIFYNLIDSALKLNNLIGEIFNFLTRIVYLLGHSLTYNVWEYVYDFSGALWSSLIIRSGISGFGF